jgi:hypothetical protein
MEAAAVSARRIGVSVGCGSPPGTFGAEPEVGKYSIRNVADLEASIRARTATALDAAYQECVRSGHVWQELEINVPERGPAAYCAACLRLQLSTCEGWPVWPAE